MSRTLGRQRGQIMPLFTIFLTALLAMASLLFDGAHALQLRRQLQDASDAAALAGANAIQANPGTAGWTPGCSNNFSAVQTAARSSVASNLPSYPQANVAVSCPSGWSNYAVQVDLNATSATFFGGVLGVVGLHPASMSQALNGQIATTKFSVVELDPYHSTWGSSTNGCPSVLFSGGPTVIFDGSMQVDSACPTTGNLKGALSSNGNAATVTFNNGSGANLVGGYAPGPLVITPTPVTGQPTLLDPLRTLPAIPWTSGSFPVKATTPTVVSGNGTEKVLEPGVYKGGISTSGQPILYLHPGIYVMNGGGFSIGSQAKVYSLPSSKTTTTDATWASDCATTNCGVLIYNTGINSSSDAITIGAGATMKLRPYLSTVDGTGTNAPAYQNLILWQDKSPVPTSSWAQPTVGLSGGGSVFLSGTVYAPSALVYMTGGSGGGGGGTDITLQFISWDLTIQGNSSFHFYYQSDSFAKPTDYGLIQ